MAALAVTFFPFLVCCSTTGEPHPITTREVAYQADGVALKGYLAQPADTSTVRPGVLIVHEWWGHNDYVRRRAEQLAAEGYVAFALDMYGDGKTAGHPKDATAFMQEVMGNAELMEARFRAALSALRGASGVDPKRTGALGYCMGGAIVLRMARTTDELDVVASFHGSLGAVLGVPDTGGAKAVFLAHGDADQFVSNETLEKLTAELKKNPKVREVKVSSFAGASHGFTNPDATKKGAEFGLPLRYDADADAQSWQTTLDLLAKWLR
jgi:dienelactone hydrolase